MNIKIIIMVLLLVGAMLLGACASGVRFKGISALPGKQVTLNGTLYKPEGNGPFPAVVLLHGCSGVKQRAHIWASRLKSWGYVAFIVDSFGPRGVYNDCGRRKAVSKMDRTLDAHSAKSYLAGLPFVDLNRIGVMGFSQGGSMTISSVDVYFMDLLLPGKNDYFKLAIAFYPYCNSLLDKFNAPLLILIGEKDDWTPAHLCSGNMPKGKTKHEVILKIYPGAYHDFDESGKDVIYMGHVLRYNHKAASDAIVQVKKFLAKYLK